MSHSLGSYECICQDDFDLEAPADFGCWKTVNIKQNELENHQSNCKSNYDSSDPDTTHLNCLIYDGGVTYHGETRFIDGFIKFTGPNKF